MLYRHNYTSGALKVHDFLNYIIGVIEIAITQTPNDIARIASTKMRFEPIFKHNNYKYCADFTSAGNLFRKHVKQTFSQKFSEIFAVSLICIILL